MAVFEKKNLITMTETNSQPVLFEEKPADNGARAGVACLNVEKTLNSLSLEMIDLLLERLSAWATDPGIAFVVLEGAGEKAFCAGAEGEFCASSVTAENTTAAAASNTLIEDRGRVRIISRSPHAQTGYVAGQITRTHASLQADFYAILGGRTRLYAREYPRYSQPAFGC